MSLFHFRKHENCVCSDLPNVFPCYTAEAFRIGKRTLSVRLAACIASDGILLRFLELAFMDLAVDFAGLNEIIMFSDSGHSAVVHDDDLIGIFQTGRALGDDKDCRLRRKQMKSPSQSGVRRKVECAVSSRMRIFGFPTRALAMVRR